MEINMTKIYKTYRGMWIALNDSLDKVLGKGRTAKEAYKQAIKNGYKTPVLFKVPEKNIAYVG